MLEGVKADTEYSPTLIFTSATAAMKGSAQCASFATGKFAMRALAQSLAREFGPQGIHVVHAIIDGVIDIERTKMYKIDHPEGKIKPEAVSRAAYWNEFILMSSRSRIHTGTCILNQEHASRTKSTSGLRLKSGSCTFRAIKDVETCGRNPSETFPS